MNEIEIKFTLQERDLIIDHTFTGPDLTKRLQIAEIKGKHLIVKYSTYHLDELIGFIAVEANHTEDKKIREKLDRLFKRLTRILEKKIDNQRNQLCCIKAIKCCALLFYMVALCETS